MDALEQIARALLYEGYILWPYRRSAVKNQQRWTFGGVYPAAFAAASGGTDRASARTECVVEAPARARLDVSVRFLHVIARQVMRADADALVPVDELMVAGVRHLSWDEATERECHGSLALEANHTSCELPIAIAAGEVREPLLGAEGHPAGAIERRWAALDGAISIEAEPVGDHDGRRVVRVGVQVSNTSRWPGLERAEAVRRTLVATHVVLCAHGGAFVSMVDPPDGLGDVARACRNDGLWPVLVGDENRRDTMLAAPIILYDYPRVAPESPGDTFDGGEIDQLLMLNVLALSDDEQREMRDTDPRARELAERCASLSADDLMRLHGTIRAMRPLSTDPEAGGAAP